MRTRIAPVFVLCITHVIGFSSPVVNLHKQSISLRMSDMDVFEDEVMLTPSQVKLLRKEITKRSARGDLTSVLLPEEETMGPFSSDTMEIISKKFETNELVQVRGVAKQEKKFTRDVSERLAFEVGMEMDRDVAMVQLKGHAAVLFSPGDDTMKGKIILRTSYQPGKWAKKPKAPRDHRGQIIRE